MIRADKSKKRIFLMLVIITLILLGLIYRLYIIQIRDTRDFSKYHIDLVEKSVQQREQEFVLSTGRGNIYDRDLESLTKQDEINTIIIFPFGKDNIDTDNIKTLADIVGMDYNELLNQVKNTNSPKYIVRDDRPISITDEQFSTIEKLNLVGIVVTPYSVQDYDNVVAKHVVGYMGQAPDKIMSTYAKYVEQGILNKNSLIGRSGLQMNFEEILMGVGKSSIAYFVDNKGRPLNGLSTSYQLSDDNFFPLSLVTTIDKEIQSLAEMELKKYQIDEGSIVVLDVDNGDILAMASAPDFNLLKVDPNSPDWNNKAVQIAEPGSVYKIIIAIAALEEGVVTLDEKFNCTGEYDYHFSCHTTHGELTFEEGFAESCNIVFAEVAKRLGAEKIEEYAKKLGVVGLVGWKGDFFKNESFKQIANEETNRVFHSNTIKEDTGSLIRTAVGQQDVRISPLAAANLIVTILNDGQVYEPRLVEKVIYKNGMDYYKFPLHKDEIGDISKETFATVRYLMEKVVEDGTGKSLNSATWTLAGKSGTAETNNNLNNQWFVGYGPSKEPKYAVAVLDKNVSSGTSVAQMVFLDLMNDLVEYESGQN